MRPSGSCSSPMAYKALLFSFTYRLLHQQLGSTSFCYSLEAFKCQQMSWIYNFLHQSLRPTSSCSSPQAYPRHTCFCSKQEACHFCCSHHFYKPLFQSWLSTNPSTSFCFLRSSCSSPNMRPIISPVVMISIDVFCTNPYGLPVSAPYPMPIISAPVLMSTSFCTCSWSIFEAFVLLLQY